jgi:hypothetical protein
MHTEHQAYHRMLQTELAGQGGRYAVIVGDRLLGTFGNYNEALVAGYQECDFSPFLLRKVPVNLPQTAQSEMLELRAA